MAILIPNEYKKLLTSIGASGHELELQRVLVRLEREGMHHELLLVRLARKWLHQ